MLLLNSNNPVHAFGFLSQRWVQPFLRSSFFSVVCGCALFIHRVSALVPLTFIDLLFLNPYVVRHRVRFSL